MKFTIYLTLFMLWASYSFAMGGAAQGNPKYFPPVQAANAGYTQLTFGGPMTSKTVDASRTYASGFSWYCTNFFQNNPTTYCGNPLGIAFNNDGSATMGVTTNKSSVASVGYISPGVFKGSAFGGGAYIEALLQPLGYGYSGQWQAFWSMSLEHLAYYPNGDDASWGGSAPAHYAHYAENDFMEYAFGNGNTQYAATMHDWYGIYNVTCSFTCNSQSAQAIEGGEDLRIKYHTYGMLWIPATISTLGYVQYYFDDKPVGSPITWTQYSAALDSPPPTGQSWRYSIMDLQHLVALLDSEHASQMNVKWVHVWQTNSLNNLVQ